jgi:molybdopterin-containing oxidoreductase family iron-sulfur binding subunit
MNPRKDLAPAMVELQRRLEGAAGKKYWRSLEELADTEAFQELMRQEFPEQSAESPPGFSRRQFLALMGASLGLAGLSGCSVRPAPSEMLVPYVKAPEELVPGRPLYYATAMTLGGTGVGLLVESHMGRPTKIEGNPEHPASRGGTDIYHQASILTLYDPDRSQTVTHLGQTTTWDDFQATLRNPMQKVRDRLGEGLYLLTETVVSPTLGRQIGELLGKLDRAKWHQYEPLARDNAYRGSRLAFDRAVNVYYDFRKADVVVSLDADFLTCGPGNLCYVADFMERRRVRTGKADAPQARMNRLYAVETALSNTGAKADHRLALPFGRIETFARALAFELKVPGIGEPGELPEDARRLVKAIVADLRYLDPEQGGKRDRERPEGTTLVLAGDRQPPAVHLLAHAINDRLRNVGKTVLHTEPIETRPVDHTKSLRELVEDMDRGAVELLVIVGGNPVFTAPADFHFTERLQNVPLRVGLGLYQDETAWQCHWHLPETHFLEAWSDTRAFDGTASIAQPLIEPLYQGRSAHEVMSLLVSLLGVGPRLPGYEIVRATWREHFKKHGPSGGDFQDFWEKSVHDGVVELRAPPPLRAAEGKAGDHEEDESDRHRNGLTRTPVSLKERWQEGLGEGTTSPREEGRYELLLVADPTIYDGRFANNGWLQELPKPITSLAWDNAAQVSPRTAKELGVELGSYAHGGEHGGFYQPVVELQLGETSVRAPVWIVPGQADGTVTVALGYGRQSAGRIGGGDGQRVGFDAYLLRTSDRLWSASGLIVHKTGHTKLLACTQQHQLMENRDLVRSAALGTYREEPDFATAHERKHEERELQQIGEPQGRKSLALYDPPQEKSPNQWGMAIDLTACTGCKACVVACQAENNIPVVGKEQVAAGRSMHWLRIDRYNSGPPEAPTEFHFQPVPCMHCEQAPCEYVCPTAATVHSADGLNDMVYQRCVGTRFCSNNCPYKVRRFNFFFFADYTTPSTRLQYNPDVTVRSRGVMEKCTYCVQRLRQAQIDSQREGRDIFDGEVLTACQAACPAGAIVFGDLNGKQSEVRRWKDSPLNYSLLADLNTRPRTTYLAALRNPNPELEKD